MVPGTHFEKLAEADGHGSLGQRGHGGGVEEVWFRVGGRHEHLLADACPELRWARSPSSKAARLCMGCQPVIACLQRCTTGIWQCHGLLRDSLRAGRLLATMTCLC